MKQLTLFELRFGAADPELTPELLAEYAARARLVYEHLGGESSGDVGPGRCSECGHSTSPRERRGRLMLCLRRAGRRRRAAERLSVREAA